MQKPLTGRTVFYWLCGFFGVMFIANGFFVWFALTSWTGIDVKSSYRAGIKYKHEIVAGAEQKKRGWRVDGDLGRASSGLVSLTFTAEDADGDRLAGTDFRARLKRPTNSSDDRVFELAEISAGRYAGDLSGVPAGQWDLVIEAYEDDARLYRSVSRKHLTQ